MKGTPTMLNAPLVATSVVDGRWCSPYLPEQTLGGYLAHVEASQPPLRAALDFEREGTDSALAALVATTTEFDTDATGRGDSYRRAQRDASVRWSGARQLLHLCGATDAEPGTVILDVLGGDGTLARALRQQDPASAARLSLLTGDISGEMVAQALAHGLPAVRQAADFLFLRDGSVDATLLAYGTHHISPAERPTAVREALRVTRPQGRVVLHDFDEASPMARFFGRVVHHHSTAGHDYPHFSREELHELFAAAGSPVEVLDVYDPLVVRADTEAEARQRMCDYVADMYGISTLFDRLGPADSWRLLEECFDHEDYLARLPHRPEGMSSPVVHRADGRFVAEVPRVAIVAVADKAV
ncbi:class I SAM-dependent methyltransferase [Micromonospora sp. NPDC049275]|uniref:class I SAM-dependent methyltransferase n=1 Tax=Micromonospora sp. NPDC049275 TaxID=3364268 RepID=UPI00371A0686